MFKRSRLRFIPMVPGCYVLTTFSQVVLYIGLTENLRRRMGEHLDSPKKTAETKFGTAFLFHWFETAETFKVERTWLNIHLQHEGVLPLLNAAYSPISI
jgi:excinuclease UvrABC nuclease subunit